VALSDVLKHVTISPDNRSFVLEYDGRRELRHSDSDKVVPLVGMPYSPISGSSNDFADAELHFSPDSRLVFVPYTGKTGELWRTDTDQLVPLAGSVGNVTFSLDSQLFFVSYTEKPGELWMAGDAPQRLRSDIADVFFAQPAPYTLTRNASSEVYLLDPAWFRVMKAYAQSGSQTELIQHTCSEILLPAGVDQTDLERYLGARTPQACS
jgi:hypothetical protein